MIRDGKVSGENITIYEAMNVVAQRGRIQALPAPVLLEFTRIEALAGVKRAKYNPYGSLVRPLLARLNGSTPGVRFQVDGWSLHQSST